MLQFQTKDIDICRLSKLLVRYNIKASITDEVITLDGNVSEELIEKLCGLINIDAVQNFTSQVPFFVPKEISFAQGDETIQSEDVSTPEIVAEPQAISTLSRQPMEYNLIYSKVKRGEVYWCDFGEPYGHEQGGERPAIIVQNDLGNSVSPTTIVLACTTAQKKSLPVHYNCRFSSKTFVDYDEKRCSSEENVILAEQFHTIDKSRLRGYIGTLTPEIMEEVQKIIDISLQSNREVKTIVKEKIVYIDRPVLKEAVVKTDTPKERKDVNMVQVQLLSFVDINLLKQISQGNFSDKIKAEKILELFGFNLKQNGVQYLLKAIIASPKDAYFNLDTLSEKVSRKEGVSKEEIIRLIVARVKERFSFKKAPTIDFIRLVNTFLLKQEEEDEEANV